MGFRNTGFTVRGGGLKSFFACEYSRLSFAGCFRRLTLSRKTRTPEKISGMFTATNQVKPRKITARPQHG